MLSKQGHVEEKTLAKDSSSLSSPTDVKLVFRSKMIAGLLFVTVVAMILGYLYVAHIRSMSSLSNESDDRKIRDDWHNA